MNAVPPAIAAAGAMTHAHGDAAEVPSTPFGLRWSIKPRFLDYVARTTDGRAYLSDGVVPDGHHEFLFPYEEDTPHVASSAAAEASGPPAGQVFAFRGGIVFSAHFGMLYVRVAHPRITLRGDTGELTVANPASDDDAGLRLVSFTVAGGTAENGLRRWEATDVRLAPEGVELFGDVYQAGEPFASLTITVPGHAV
jgi:hypothetical protein